MQSKSNLFLGFSPRMYFGAGGQSIPIHFDEIENLLHLVDGTKEVFPFLFPLV